jgi:hypothetical protein
MGRAHSLMLGILLLCGVHASAAMAQGTGSAVLLRVFLTDGTHLASYGEWARLGDRVVFSMPLDAAAASPDLHLVSIASDRIDWPRTEQYAGAVRASHYASTRGEYDFAAFSAEIARVLNDIALLPDAASRLDTAERARRSLVDWPRRHFGYRAREVREMLGLLDEVIAELRIAAGQERFDLALVADGPSVPEVALLPPPSQSELAEQLLLASQLATTPAERQSLLQALLGVLDRAVDLLPPSLATRLRGEAAGMLAEERRLERAYGALRVSTLAAAQRHAARADVRQLERLRASVNRDDEALGRQRPESMTALLATIEAQLDAARRLRLAQDQWRMRIDGYRAYRRSVAGAIDALRGATASLEDIRAQAGPSPRALASLDTRLAREGRRFTALTPPADLAPVHALLRSAWDLASNAVRLRLEAVSTASLEQAGHASAAAAGSLMLLARARTDLDAALRPPTLP